jgi:putative membrane protein
MLLNQFTAHLRTSTPLAVVCGLVLFAQGSFTRPARREKLSSDDASFLKDAAQDGMAEVQFAQLALKKTARPSIKKCARRMIADHTKTNEKLNAIAKANHVDLPSGVGLKNDAEKARLTILSGKDFDYSFVNAMVDDHKSVVEKYEKEAPRADSPEVKQFIATTLPILKQHLQMVRTTEGDLLSTNRKVDGRDR